MTSSAEADRLLHWMPMVIRAPGLSPEERKFCASMIARNRRGGFRPSQKQCAWMGKLVAAFQAEAFSQDSAP